MKDNVLAFIGGSTTGLVASFGQRVMETFILGLVGGIAGLVGKEVLFWIKRKIKKNK